MLAPSPYAGDGHPLPLPPPVYHNFRDATQSALFSASTPCPFLILAGALEIIVDIAIRDFPTFLKSVPVAC